MRETPDRDSSPARAARLRSIPRWVIELLGALAVVLTLFFILYLPILLSPNLGKPIGKTIPDEPPD